MPHLSMHSPVGDLTLFEDDGAIVALEWGWAGDPEPTALLVAAQAALDSYFDTGTIRTVPLRPAGTAYQQRVWALMRTIPDGATQTYGALAHDLASGPRAVAGACARNPIPILIPCHRVVGATGLGGYSGDGGAATKRALLRLEGLDIA